MILEDIRSLLQQGEASDLVAAIQKALGQGYAPQTILNEGLLSAMTQIGEDFKNHEIFIPEVMIASRAMNVGLDILKPLLINSGQERNDTVIIGTVKGDHHDIGKNIVKIMMEGQGLNVIDLGVDVSAEQYLSAAQEHNAKVICCSALLTTTMDEMRNVVDLVKRKALSDKIKIMIGGAVVSQAYCEIIGADCYTPDASAAASAAVALCS